MRVARKRRTRKADGLFCPLSFYFWPIHPCSAVCCRRRCSSWWWWWWWPMHTLPLKLNRNSSEGTLRRTGRERERERESSVHSLTHSAAARPSLVLRPEIKKRTSLSEAHFHHTTRVKWRLNKQLLLDDLTFFLFSLKVKYEITAVLKITYIPCF